MLYEYDFLDKNQLRQILSLFDAGKFVDGAITGTKEKEIKDNTQQEDIELNKMANAALGKEASTKRKSWLQGDSTASSSTEGT